MGPYFVCWVMFGQLHFLHNSERLNHILAYYFLFFSNSDQRTCKVYIGVCCPWIRFLKEILDEAKGQITYKYAEFVISFLLIIFLSCFQVFISRHKILLKFIFHIILYPTKVIINSQKVNLLIQISHLFFLSIVFIIS